MKVAAVVPMKLNSRRLPGKNIKSFTAFEDDADEIDCLEVFRRYAPKRL